MVSCRFKTVGRTGTVCCRLVYAISELNNGQQFSVAIKNFDQWPHTKSCYPPVNGTHRFSVATEHLQTSVFSGLFGVSRKARGVRGYWPCQGQVMAMNMF